jgi:hypothetical protein
MKVYTKIPNLINRDTIPHSRRPDGDQGVGGGKIETKISQFCNENFCFCLKTLKKVAKIEYNSEK